MDQWREQGENGRKKPLFFRETVLVSRGSQDSGEQSLHKQATFHLKILSHDQLFRESKRSPETKVRKVVTHLGCLLMPVSELGRQRQEQHMFWAMLGCTVRPRLRNQKQSCYLLEVRSSLKTLCLVCCWRRRGPGGGRGGLAPVF